MDQKTWDIMTPSQKDKERDLSDLVSELIGLEGWRLEASYPDGTKARFYLSRSTGWRPCHIQVSRRSSFGGPQLYWPTGTTFRKLYRR
jgi:hypothetical protein